MSNITRKKARLLNDFRPKPMVAESKNRNFEKIFYSIARWHLRQKLRLHFYKFSNQMPRQFQLWGAALN